MQYQIAITVTYAYVLCSWASELSHETRRSPYIATELPANLLLRKIGPGIMMPTILVIWDMIAALQGRSLRKLSLNLDFEMAMCQGTVKSFGGLDAARAFLGLVEGTLFPGMVLYLSGFYTRKELSLR